MADAADRGLLAWASAYAIDLWVAGPFALGAEATLLLGATDRRVLAAPAAGLSVGLEFGPLVLGAGVRFALNDDAIVSFGRIGVVVALRSSASGARRIRP
jgi:hypothetical protein